MGEGDYMPIGGHRKKYDPKHAKKIKEGGRKAQKIAAKSHKHHHEVEVPVAEAQLKKDLAELNGLT